MGTTKSVTDVTVFRPDLPPLDAAAVLIGKGRDHVSLAGGMARGLRATATAKEQEVLASLIGALDTAIEKQEAAAEKIREYQSIPGSN